MGRKHWMSAFLLGGLAGPGPGAAAGDAATAEATLKDKGLEGRGNVAVLTAEAPVLAKLAEVRATYAAWAGAVDKLATLDQEAARRVEVGELRIQARYNIDALSTQISSFPRNPDFIQKPRRDEMIAQRDQLREGLKSLDLEHELLVNRVPSPRARTDLAAEIKEKGEAFKAGLGELRPSVDEVEKAYAELAKDPKVKAAVDDLNAKRAKATRLRLGPSDGFAAGARELDQAERRFLAKPSRPTAAPARKKARAKK